MKLVELTTKLAALRNYSLEARSAIETTAEYVTSAADQQTKAAGIASNLKKLVAKSEALGNSKQQLTSGRPEFLVQAKLKVHSCKYCIERRDI